MSPFRELFVELSEQAMLAAQAAIGVEIEKQKPASIPAHRALVLFPRDGFGYLFRERYGLACEVRAAAMRGGMEILYRDGCRHTQRIDMSWAFWELHASPDRFDAVIDLVDKKFDERRCYCVRRAP